LSLSQADQFLSAVNEQYFFPHFENAVATAKPFNDARTGVRRLNIIILLPTKYTKHIIQAFFAACVHT
jgi:hypothetical protein